VYEAALSGFNCQLQWGRGGGGGGGEEKKEKEEEEEEEEEEEKKRRRKRSGICGEVGVGYEVWCQG